VTWYGNGPSGTSGSIFGAFLPADAPWQAGTPFHIVSNATMNSVVFDGSDFIVAWKTTTTPSTVGTAVVTMAGAVDNAVLLPLDTAESATAPAISAAPGMPALLGYVDVHPANDSRSRSALLFRSEFVAPRPAIPSPPSVMGASRIDQSTIDVRWLPSAGGLGTAVELQLDDGTYRTIGVAGSAASSARFSLAGLQGSAVRLRAWNAAGLSDASALVSIVLPLPRQHAVRH
jgi:hypothetical protein